MKVLFTTDQIYLHGGIEKVLGEKVNYLCEQSDIEVHIMTTEQSGRVPCYTISSKVMLHDLEINYERSKSYFSLVNLGKSLRHYFRLRRYLHKLKPDVVVMCNYAFDFYFMPFLYRKAAKVKEYHSSRFFDQQKEIAEKSLLKKKFYALQHYIESRYNALVLLNKDEAAYYPKGNTVVIPNPITIPPGKMNEVRNPWVAAAGRIAPVKGFQYLVEAWEEVHKVLPDWKLHIYGADYLGTQAQLEKLISEKNLASVVQFKGVVPDMAVVLPQYSLYAMSSETECFPMILLESMACGVPVVSFDSPNGPRNIISDGDDGLLADYKNIKDLAEKIIFLAHNPGERTRMEIAARNNVQRFSVYKVMQLWITLFKQLAK